jgi:LmbE family N-acetylglucosaminyl deacetylase
MRKLYILVFVLAFFNVEAQKPSNPNSAEILLKLKKLNFLGSVLYLAAHPDDENTRLIAQLSNERLANTGYLSMTRGDGGQNLVGPEIREGLGIIRTQELLAARRIDGGQQFFTRANDFGYSKSTEETQEIWNRDQVLSDVVWVYRNFKPDVVITRFPPDGRGGHGHHTTSAIFAEEAYKLSNDKNVYSSQLEYVDLWQPKRVLMNTGRWWSPDINENTPGVVTIDVGSYNTLLGTSYTEMAALSRTKHKSQGFGSTGSRGETFEFLEHTIGEKAEKDIFEGIDTSWKRIKGGEKIGTMIEKIIDNYDFQNPTAVLPDLFKVRDAIYMLNEKHWKTLKIKEIDEIVKGMLGLYLEAKATDFSVSPGDKIGVEIEVINRSNVPVKLEKITYDHLADSTTDIALNNNQSVSFKTELDIPAVWQYSQPYWLREVGTLGTYKVDDQLLRGTPENKPAIDVVYYVDVMGHKLTYVSPLIYKWNDPVDGEQYRPFIITPPVFVKIPESVYIFSTDEAKSIEITVKSGEANVKGEVKLKVPSNWKVSPLSHPVNLSLKDEEAHFTFTVLPPKGENVAEFEAVVTIEGKDYNRSLETIKYDHIPTQVIMSPSSSRLVKIDIKRKGNVIGYIQGAGDAIPASLREIGYEVWEMKEDEITPDNLAKVDAVVLGVRALNTNDRVKFYMPDLLNYVHEGGTMIVQYNTSFRLKTEDFAPYPISLSHDRVTEEDAEVKILDSKHPLMNTPNKITAADFEGWVQERGLYFPNEWDSHYETLLSSHDKGEDAKDGGLLVTKYGEGNFIYTGYSWFRQLPAGVPGAYRLFVNMVSLGQQKKPSENKISNPQ